MEVAIVVAAAARTSSWRICFRFLLRRTGAFQYGFLKGFARGEMSRGSRIGFGVTC